MAVLILNIRSIRCLLTFLGTLVCLPGFSQQASERPLLPGDTAAIFSRLYIPPNVMHLYPDSAFRIASRNLEQSRILGYTYGAGWSLMDLGLLAQDKGQYPESIRLFNDAMELLQRTAKGPRETPRLLSYIGNAYNYMGNVQLGLHYQLKALDLAQNFYPDINVDYIYNNTAAIFSAMNRSPEVIRYYMDQAERLAIRFRNYPLLGAISLNKGNNYLAARAPDSCAYYLQRAVQLGRASGDLRVEYIALMNTGVLWLERDRPDSAIVYLQQARTGEQAIPLAARKLLAGSLGRAYLFNGRAQEADPLIREQYRDAVDTKDTVSLRDAYYNMFLLEDKLGRYREASRFAGDYIRLNEKLSGQAIYESVNEQEIQYRSAEKEKDLVGKQLKIARQEKLLATQNTWLTVIIGGIVTLLLLAAFAWHRYTSRQKLLRARLRDLEQTTQIETLKATIQGEEQERIRIARELHDGLGAMTSTARINLGLLKQQDAESAQVLQSTTRLLDEISADLRFTAHNMMPRALMEKDLPKAVATFCEYIGRNKPFTINVQTFGDFTLLPEYYLLSTYRIVQELVHNAEKHAGATAIFVQLSYRDALLSITVEDDGKGFDARTVTLRKGLGLDSIRGRAQSLGGDLVIDSAPGSGTSVTLDIQTLIPVT
ncbi:tetratricopeptide repeat-containing sensor histidine kinase [Taibaiella koreensis]|uniref:tetratricopeptide repeat-containing sensor histidine kinase n=1 Tax=Taibaiella koreensis TaxID=1268548 RepID=UPI000E599596|nr:sensor histidine kinase [Taibaiella koreensis]